MIDDTKDPNGPRLTSSDLATSFEEIRAHTTSRQSIQGWSRTLRFLTYDDITDSDPGQPRTSSPRQFCGRCLSKDRVLNDHDCSRHLHPAVPEFQKTVPLNGCEHVSKLTCKFCKDIPLFPSSQKVTKFRIRRVIEKDQPFFSLNEDNKYSDYPCGHYVAVSYCWAAQESDDSKSKSDETPYQVVEEDGSVRNMRAPAHTVDRVVSFASENGYRMIWIDQECIEQDNETEKRIAVQCMDDVYLYSHLTIGLFNTYLGQDHLNALFLASELHVGPRLGLRPRQSKVTLRKIEANNHIKSIAEAMRMVVLDPWNTRAWILQEVWISMGKLLILLPHRQDVNVGHLRLLCHEKSATEICLGFDILCACLDWASSVIKAGSSIELKNPDQVTAFERMKRFCPRSNEEISYNLDMRLLRSYKRPISNAATVLAFLQDRNNTIVSDRLAIIANMCCYELRLDTTDLENSQYSLGTCIIAQSLMNGDFSLMTPELHISKSFSAVDDMTFNELLIYCIQEMSNLQSDHIQPAASQLGFPAPESYYLDSRGLRLPGFLWKLDRFVRFDNIQARYREPWSRLCSEREIILSDIREKHGKLTARQRTSFNTHMRHRERATTQILFQIITELLHRGETAIANSIWQSVWNRSWNRGFIQGLDKRWKFQGQADFPADSKIENRRDLFQLRRHGIMTFHPEWLIERILKDAGFWAASLVRASQDTSYVDHIYNGHLNLQDLFDEAHMTPLSEGPITEVHSQADSQDLSDEAYTAPLSEGPITEVHSQADSQDLSDEAYTAPRSEGPITELHSQADSQDLSDEAHMVPRSEETTALDYFKNIDTFCPRLCDLLTRAGRTTYSNEAAMLRAWGNTGTLAGTTYSKGTSSKSQRSDEFKTQRALFIMAGMGRDIQGSLQQAMLNGQSAVFDYEPSDKAHLILTPFVLPYEDVSNGEFRTMSNSWVVQTVDDGDPNAGYETFRIIEMVRGMRELLPFPGGRYSVI